MNPRLSTICTVIFLFVTLEADASIAESAALSPTVTSTRRSLFEKPLTTRFMMELPSHSIELSGVSDQKPFDIEYSPNARMIVGAGLSYEGYNFNFMLPVPSSQEDIAQKGQTHHLDFVFSRYWSGSGLEIIIDDYRGFYIDDDQVDSDNHIYEKRPDLRLKSVGLNYYHVFSPENYSLEAARNSRKDFTKTGGSWLALVSVNQLHMEADHTLGAQTTIAGIESTSATLSGGYGYAWLKNSSRISGDFLLGWGPEWQYHHLLKERRQRVALARKTTLNLSYSYDFSNWLAGLTVRHHSVSSPLGEVDLSSNVTSVLMFTETQF